jgi:uncharacterized RDD family membrane protein YckC
MSMTSVSIPIDAARVSTEVYASAWPRLIAWFIDLVASVLLAAPLAFAAGTLFAFALDRLVPKSTADEGDNLGASMLTLGVLMLVFGAVYLAYHTITTARDGGGVGKRMMGLRVVMAADGTHPTYGIAFLRSILPPALWSCVNIMWWVDNIWCIWDPKRQTLHDKMSGTIVIRRERDA